MTTESLLDAVTAGIESAGPTVPMPEVSDDEGNDTADDLAADAETGSEVEGGESEASGDEGAADGVEGEPEADADASGEETDPDASADGATADGKPDGQKTGELILKAKDPVNDPIPNALKKETKERVESLIGIVREKDAAIKEATTKFNDFVGMVTQTGSTPEQYGQALTYLSLVNSGDPVKIEQALTFMQGEVAALAKMLGKPVAGVDMLAEFPELKQQVADNLMLQEHAEEIAAGRVRAKIATTQSQQRATTKQEQDAQTKAITDGKAALNAIGAQQAKTDKDFARKREILVSVLKPTFDRLHPSQWAAAWEQAYKKLVLPVAPATGNVLPKQPLRGKTPAGGSTKAPGSLLDAITAGIESAGR